MTAKVKAGMQFRAVIADANALWKVVSHQGRQSWLCEVVNEPIVIDGKTYPGEYTGQQKAFLASEILRSVAWETTIGNLIDQGEQWYKNLPLGTTVHYHNGFDAFVRCEVVTGTDQSDNQIKNMLKPIALVGNWSQYDLPSRSYDGKIHLGYHAKQISEHTLFRPNASNCYEFSGFLKKKIDPRTLTPVALGLPSMTAEESKAAELWQIIENIHDLTDSQNFRDEDLKSPETPMKYLQQIAELTKDYRRR